MTNPSLLRIILAVSGQANFISKLRSRWQLQESLVCVGLDPDPARLPAALAGQADAVGTFCREIVDATAQFVCAFKPQAAYFGALGLENELADLINYIHARHPGIPVILDAKRGDIGATATLYAREAFERYAADAVTINPYLGRESVEPYLEYADKGIVLLCRTSNPGSAWLQNYPKREPVYLRVAREAAVWNTAGNVMLVAGATYPDDLARIRACVGEMPLLVPGIGAQGGDLAQVLQSGSDRSGAGLVINASRSILYASDQKDFASAAALAACTLRDQIRALQAQMPQQRKPES